MTIHIDRHKTIQEDQLERLYLDVQWTAYTDDLQRLTEALDQSLDVISAWDEDELVGLARVVGDGLTIIYIQDILVLQAYQNYGIGSQLLEYVLEDYSDVRQKVLLTEEAADVRHFYEKHGFQSCDKGHVVAFANFS